MATKNFAEAIRRKLASDKGLAAAVDDERLWLSVGSAIFEARTRAGLTQQQLAKMVSMHQSAIARLESADYHGYSLKTLQRIANAVGARLQVVFAEQSARETVVSVEEFALEYPNWTAESEQWEPLISTTGPDSCGQGAVA